ncbi:MAG TPA: NIPSNAP family protein, partial [Anaeromyxobacteraceae bacterium]|nr:NIPSNAP family protein [Anaeromyxobacteraceae bacterium]
MPLDPHALDAPIAEFRRYTLRPGARDTLIELFERELLLPQEASGMRILAQFRDLDHPDTFTWMRAFPSAAVRKPALEAFYLGPVWARHREAANATMLDSDDVRLLRPVPPSIGLGVDGERSATGAPTGRLVVATVYTL